MRHARSIGGLGLVLLVVASAGFGGGPGGPPPPPIGPPPPPPGSPLPGLSKSQVARFRVGLAQFTEVEDLAGGLGPVFNDSSCSACHSAGGTGGGGTRVTTRFGRIVNNQYDNMVEFGGPLVQAQGIGRINGVDFVGEVVPPQATIVAHRRSIPLFGLGLVDAVPDAALVMLAQIEEQANPMTAGKLSLDVDLANGGNVVGRFGWKAQHASVFAFASDAYSNEIGVTTPLLPSENCPQGNCSMLVANPAATEPNDTDDSSVQALADFITFLAPPPRGPVGPQEQAGQGLFGSIGCAQCHNPTIQTGPNAVASLDRVTISPFSDFLLHDMGGLGDGIVQNQAGPTEMRTAPLWGLRFQTTFLHDGRATSIADAILQHAGQGLGARNQFARLNPAQQAQVVAFLKSL